jgi:cell division protein FtsB
MEIDRKKTTGLILLLAFLFLQGAVWLLVNSLVVKKTIDFSKKREEVVTLAKENSKLKRRVYKLSSLVSIRERALKNGLQPIGSVALSGVGEPMAWKVDLLETNRE